MLALLARAGVAGERGQQDMVQHRVMWLAGVIVVAAGLAAAQPEAEAPSAPPAASAIEGIVSEGTPIVRAHTGLRFTEGPAADADGNVYFTDLAMSKIHIARTDGALETFMEGTEGCNGLAFDRAGRLLACQGGKGRIIAIETGTKEIGVVADSFDGRPLGRVNDLAPDAHGGVYFTDPMLGRRADGDTTPPAVYYVNAAAEVTRVIDDAAAPNGVLISPDGKTLYVLPYTEPQCLAYPIEGPGKLGEGRVLCELESPEGRGGRRAGGDGLTVDEKGNLYLTVPTGRLIQVVSPEGKTLGTIDVPEPPANCAFGGEGFSTLFITARSSVYTVELSVKGHRP